MKNPIEYADALWDMNGLLGSWRFPYELESAGPISFQQLEGEDWQQSISRGLDGHVCHLDNSYIFLNSYRAAALRPDANCFSFYMRVKLEQTVGVTLLSSDFLGLTIHHSGYICAFIPQKITTGITFREVPLARIQPVGWCDFVITVGEGTLRFYLNGNLLCTLPMLWEIECGFSDDFVIGGRRCCKPDTYGTTSPHSRMKGLVDAVAIWQRVLTQDEITVLSGGHINIVVSMDQQEVDGCKAYNDFFDVSVQKDVEKCGDLHSRLQRIGSKDLSRPRYHLTQPFGAIWDPVGAFYYDGRYHIFSYRNINFMLEYSSLDHYVSEDLVHWTQWPIGPFADAKEDVFCIYLLNHIIDTNGNLCAIYTGQGHDGKKGILAYSNDGMITYTDKQTVLPQYHHDGHVFWHKDRWYTITSRLCKGLRPNGKGDPIMMFSSFDLKHWTEEGEIFSQPKTPQNPSGFLEFPYLLFFENKAVLLVGGDIRYFVGEFDWDSKTFIPDDPTGIRLDPVNPFYCFNPMCVDEKGVGNTQRRIIMGLYPNLCSQTNSPLPWNGVHTMPRILSFDGEHLKQEPIPEAHKLRGSCHQTTNLYLKQNENYAIQKDYCPFVEIEAVFLSHSQGTFGLVLHFDDEEVTITYDTYSKSYEIDGKVLEKGGSPTYLKDGEPIVMKVFVDCRLVEVYINGQVCTTATTALNPKQCKIGIVANQGDVVCQSLHVWEMNV